MKADTSKNECAPRRVVKTFRLLPVLVVLLAFAGGKLAAVPINDDFANATVITGTNGTQLGDDNFSATLELCETNLVAVDDPPIPGGKAPVNSSVWYLWTAPTNGLLTVDTIGSDFDTVLAVYTTPTDLCDPALALAGADDEGGGSGTSRVVIPVLAGTNYYIAVDGYGYTNSVAQGHVVLNWSLGAGLVGTIPSGTFGFTSDIFRASEMESSGVRNGSLSPSYPGANITVTRSAGSSGRVLVDYTIAPLTYTNNYITNLFGTNYVAVLIDSNNIAAITNNFAAQTLFNNLYGYFGLNGYQSFPVQGLLTNSLVVVSNGLPLPVPIFAAGVLDPAWVAILNGESDFFVFNFTNFNLLGGNPSGPIPTNLPPIGSRYVGVAIADTNAGTVTLYFTNSFRAEPTTNFEVVSSSAITPTTGTLAFDDYQMSASFIVTVGSDTPEPFVASLPTLVSLTLTNARLDGAESTDLLPPLTVGSSLLNILHESFQSGMQTNSGAMAYLNIEHAHLRVNEISASAVVNVHRTGNLNQSSSCSYRIDYSIPLGADQNHAFQLEPGSEYATPNEDYTSVTGTVNFGPNQAYASFSVPIKYDTVPEFNEDMLLELYNFSSNTTTNGDINFANLTILSDDSANQPAGAVDVTWNKDGAQDSDPPFLQYPGTQGGRSGSANGNGGTVYALAEQPDGKTIVAGSFVSFDSHQYKRLVRLLNNGYQDTSFMAGPNSGANASIFALALQADGKILIGGDFTSFNGVNRSRIARLNSDGTLDNSFNPGLGADATVKSIAVHPDGKVFIGGNFTNVNGVLSAHVAALNSDGSLDTTFTPGSTINGPVNTLALGGVLSLSLQATPFGSELEDVQVFNLGASRSGTVTVFYDFFTIPDDLRIYYGGTNNGVNGVRIYDTGATNDFGFFSFNFGPTNGFSTNVLTFVMNQGNGNPGTVWIYQADITTAGDNTLYIGGEFDHINGTPCGGVAHLMTNGLLDAAFAPGIGTYNPDKGLYEPVNSIALQSDGNLLVAGGFSHFELANYNGIVRLLPNGSVDMSFNPGTGTYDASTGQSDTINSIKLQQDGKILIGGDFSVFNQTRRWGVGRLFADGSVDTSFMDTAYNQFAGLVNHYHNADAVNPSLYPAGNHRNSVLALAVEPGTTNVLIGGSFLVVGGGLTRDDVHPRSNVARLIGGSTLGPGNIGLQYSSYSVDKSAGDPFGLYVSIVRTNGNLGPAGATFFKTIFPPGPGVATDSDFSVGNPLPTWPTIYSLNPNWSWEMSPATYGPNYNELPQPPLPIHVSTAPDEFLGIVNNTNFTGNVSAAIGLKNPEGFLTLGGETISIGVALGTNYSSPLTIIENNFKPGVLGFASTDFSVLQNAGTATITVTRTNGTDGIVSIHYTTTNTGTAVAGINYSNVSGTLTFNQGVSSRTFTIPVIGNTTVQPDKTVGLVLYTVSGGATIGQTNATLTIINNNYLPGHVSFTLAGFETNEPAAPTGTALISVNRLGGSSGVLAVTFAATNGTATNGFQFTGLTNTLTWNNGDASVKTISVPLKHDGIFTPDSTVTLRIYNALVNTRPSTNALGLNTNVTLTIHNIDFPGTVQFTADRYSVKKYGGFAWLPVVRTAGSAGPISVDFGTADGSATAPGQYSTTNGTLFFADGEVSKLIKVPIINTNSPAGLADLTVTLTPNTGAVGTPAVATLNILDTDPGNTNSVNEPPGTDDTSTYSSFAGFNGPVFALGLQTNNNSLYVGGDFTQANGVPRQRIARLNSDGTLDAGFSAPSTTLGADAAVRAVLVQSDGRVVIGGFFTNVNSYVNQRIARLNQDGQLDSLFNPGSGADNPVYALAETFDGGGNRKIIVGGSFATLNGATFHAVGRMNDDGTPDTSFNAGGFGASAAVNALAVQTDGKIIIGGDFTNYNGVAVGRVARLNANGTLDTSFTGIGANASVLAVAVQLDGKILIGGAFTNVNGTALNHIARLNSDGSLDSSFTPGLGADDLITAIAIQADTRIVLGGQFLHCSGVTRSHITRLNPDGTMDPMINFGMGADGLVSAIAIQQDTIAGYPTNVPDEKIIIGGAFTHYNGNQHDRIARIFGGAISGVGLFGFSTADFYVNENLPLATITVVRAGGTMGPNPDGSGNISVPFTTSDGTAFANTNYLTVTTNVVFPPGEVQVTVAVPILRDYVITPDLDVNLQVDPVFPADYGDQAIATLHILNADSSVSFSSSAYQVTKNIINGVAPINLVRNGSGIGTASVIFNTTTNGSATPNLDYTPVTNQLVTFGPGVTNMVVNIPIINNNVPEGFRTVGMTLTNPVNSAIYSPSNAELTIIDTLNSAGQVYLSATNYFVTPSGSNAVLTVLRTNGSTGVITLNYFTLAQTALPGSDFVPTNGVLTFPGGSLSQTITVPLLQPTLVQPPVAFSVILSNLQGGAQFIAPSNADVTIISSIAGISFVNATNTQPENGGSVNVQVQRLYNTNNPASVNFATVPGTAQPGANYTTTTGMLNFTNGETLKTISVPLVNDTNVTGDLQFSMQLFSPSGGQLLAQTNTVVVIQDADAGISFTNSVARRFKNEGLAIIPVFCSNPRVEPLVLTTNDVPLRVNYYTQDGTAHAGTDYQAVSGTLVFTNGIATNSVFVPLFNNAAVSGDRNFTIILTNVTAPGHLTPYPTQMVVIAESNPGFRFSQNSYSVFENSLQANINVFRTGFTDTVCSVDFVATNGTAVNGANYFATNGTLTFTNGETVKSFTVPVIANSAVQPNLTVLLQLINPVNGVLIPPSASVLNILEANGSYVIPAGAQIVSESGAGIPNGIIDSNETVTVLFAFRDAAGLRVTNLIAYLQATNGVSGVSPVSQTYGPLEVYGHSVSQPFTFTAAGTNSLPFSPMFTLYDNTNFIGTALFGFTMGTWTTNFANTNAIVIRDNTNASPYPSVIPVGGIGGTLVKATVTLQGLYHTSPADVEALVVSPSGSNTVVMANVGAQNVVTNIILTFDDDSTNSLPEFGRPATGTNKPTQFQIVKPFPQP